MNLLSAGLPRNFIKNTIEYFNKNKDDFLFLEWLFDEIIKYLIKTLVIFTDKKCKFSIIWNAKNIRSLFQIKYNIKHYSCVIYKVNCSCGENYVGEPSDMLC